MARDGGPAPLTAEESRYLDGVLSPERMRRMEHLLAADPDRADRVRAWKEWMARWREDCQRVTQANEAHDEPAEEGSSARVDVIVSAALAAAPAVEQGREPTSPTPSGWSVPAHVARRYAAAALLLMALGLVGYVATHSTPAVATPTLDSTSPTPDAARDDTAEEVNDLRGIRDAIRNDVLRSPTPREER